MKSRKFISLVMGLVLCLNLCMINAHAEYIVNTNYTGTYKYIGQGTFTSWIRVSIPDNSDAQCEVFVVYDELENKYISATGTEGYLTKDNFLVSFSRYNIVNSAGEVQSSVTGYTAIQGTVELLNNNKVIEINIHGMLYDKNFGPTA